MLPTYVNKYECRPFTYSADYAGRLSPACAAEINLITPAPNLPTEVLPAGLHSTLGFIMLASNESHLCLADIKHNEHVSQEDATENRRKMPCRGCSLDAGEAYPRGVGLSHVEDQILGIDIESLASYCDSEVGGG